MKKVLVLATVVCAFSIGTAQAQKPPVTPLKLLTLGGPSKKYEIRDQNGNKIDATLCSLSNIGPHVTTTKTPDYIAINPVAVGNSLIVTWRCVKGASTATSGTFAVQVIEPPWPVTDVGDVEIP